MKRSVLAILVAGLVVGSMATAEATKKPIRIERTVVGAYGPYPAPVTGCNSALGSFACMELWTRSHEKFFTAKLTDTHGRPVYAEVFSHGRLLTRFCGETPQPVALERPTSLAIWVGLPFGALPTGCPASIVKTTGTISVTLSNLP